jgi:hypothetical protein
MIFFFIVCQRRERDIGDRDKESERHGFFIIDAKEYN